MTLAAEMIEHQKSMRLRAVMHWLFDELRDWVRVYPRMHDDKMPDYDILFETGIGKGPEKIIMEAIAEAPELWKHALPPECCIVRRDQLTSLLGQSDIVEVLAMDGVATVENHAARARYARDERELAERYDEVRARLDLPKRGSS